MNSLIESKQAQLRALCGRYHVSRLEVFGSVTRADFDQECSDLDFLVEFSDEGIANYADCYFGLLEALGELFDRQIDLTVISSLDNPYFLRAIEKERELLYAA